jgi:hypothetical protein
VLELNLARPVHLAVHVGEGAWRWHARFEHTNFAALRKMQREELVRGLPLLDQVKQLCEACLTWKQWCTPFSQEALQCASTPLEHVPGDLCGPITPTSPSGNTYFLLLIDNYNRFMWVVVLPTKADAPDAIKHINAAVELESGHKL